MPQESLLRHDVIYQVVDVTVSGVVVTGKTGYSIVVINWLLAAASSVLARWRSNTTDIAGAINGGTVGAAPGEAIYAGHFRCVSGEDLELTLDATVSVVGSVVVAFEPDHPS